MGELSSSLSLGYATPKTDRKPAPAKLYWTAIGFWAVAAVVGCVCVLGYAATAWDGFVVGGIFWLFIGGALTFVAFVLGAIYLGFAIASKFYGGTQRRAVLAMVLPLLNLPLAWGCMWAGASFYEYYARQLNLVIANPSNVPVESIDVLVGGRVEHTFGGIDAGATKPLRTQCDGAGQLWLRVHQAGQAWIIEVDSFVAFNTYSDGPKHYAVTLVKPTSAPVLQQHYSR